MGLSGTDSLTYAHSFGIVRATNVENQEPLSFNVLSHKRNPPLGKPNQSGASL